MLKILIKVFLTLGLLSLSACSDSTNNKKKDNEVISKPNVEEVQKEYKKPPYDYRLYNYEYGKVWYDTSDIDSESSYNLGLLYQEKIKNNNLAEFWYKKAWFKSNNSKIANNLGYLFDLEKNYKQSKIWYQKSANLLNSDAMFNLGYLYEKYFNDNENAINYYEKSYKYNSIVAAHNLGVLYKKNNNPKKAIFWYKKSIHRENQKSIRNLSALYLKEGNDIKAVAYLISIVALNPKYTKDKVIKYMKTKWKVDDATIKKGYELQLTMDELSKRYTGGL